MLHAETVALARESKPKCPCGSGKPYEDCCGPLLAGSPAPDAEIPARVKFVAKARDDAGNMITLKENSRFVKENGRWYYIDGILS